MRTRIAKNNVDATAGRSGPVLRRGSVLAAFLATLFVALVAAAFTAAPASAQATATDTSAPTATNTSAPTPSFVLSKTTVNLVGATEVIKLKLSLAPTSNVRVALASSDDSKVSVLREPYTFTTSNWNRDQDVGLFFVTGASAGTATVTLTGSGGNYAGVIATITVNIVNTPTPSDTPTATNTPTNTTTPATATPTATNTATATTTPFFVINPTRLDLEARAGATATFMVALGTQPSGDNVVVRVSSTDMIRVAPIEVTFTRSNWATSQAFTVTLGAGVTPGEWTIRFADRFNRYGGLIGAVTLNLTALPTNTPAPGTTQMPTPTNTLPPPPPPGGQPDPTNTSPPPPPPGGGQPDPTNTPAPPPPPGGGQPDPTNTPASGGGGGSAPQADTWVAPGMVKHAGAPSQVFGSGTTNHFYFVGPGGVQSGPSVPSVSELARRHPKGSPVVTLWTGTNPLTGKAVRIEYLPSEEKILYITAYEDKYYKRDKPYIFTIDKNGKVSHRAW